MPTGGLGRVLLAAACHFSMPDSGLLSICVCMGICGIYSHWVCLVFAVGQLFFLVFWRVAIVCGSAQWPKKKGSLWQTITTLG